MLSFTKDQVCRITVVVSRVENSAMVLTERFLPRDVLQSAVCTARLCCGGV